MLEVGVMDKTMEYFSESLSKLLRVPLSADSKTHIREPMLLTELAYLISQLMISCPLMYGLQVRRFLGSLK